MVVSNQIHCDVSTKRGDHGDMSGILGNVFAHFTLSVSSYNDSAAMDMEPKSVQYKWQRHSAIVHAPHVSFARI